MQSPALRWEPRPVLRVRLLQVPELLQVRELAQVPELPRVPELPSKEFLSQSRRSWRMSEPHSVRKSYVGDLPPGRSAP